ncbi:HupE/UreJ family protein [Pseudomonadota bacterium]
MRLNILTVLGFLFLASANILPAYAHDIGVSESELVEKPNGQYTLSVRSGAGASFIFPAPVLPAHCRYIGNPRGALSANWKTFEFGCRIKLTAADSIELNWRRDGIMLDANWLDGTKTRRLFRNKAGKIVVPLEELQAGSGSFFKAAQRYTALGVEHILMGVDHLLFVLCLLMVVQGIWPLVKTITAFTLAHSITLGLATLGFVDFSTVPVEASIALSIVFLAAEILRHHRCENDLTLTYRAPWLIAFGFGLLHGFGFAGALADLGLPPGEIPVALLFFNVGVEFGQLIFVGLIIVLAYFLRRIAEPARDLLGRISAYGIGGLGAYWFLERSVRLFIA